jgi:hypothetical protein
MTRKLLVYLVCVALVWSGVDSTQAVAVATPAKKTPEEVRQAVLQYLELAQELRALVDRTQFDAEALLDRLDYEPDAIVALVRDEIQFEPYNGLLRGANGTLMAGAGNSLDQSVLLAKMLNDAGFEARILQGKLSNEEAKKLLSLTRETQPPETPFVNSEAARKVLRKIAAIVDMPTGQVNRHLGMLDGDGAAPGTEELRRAAQGETRALLDLLGKHGTKLGDENILGTITAQTQDYFWVQYREDTVEWTDIHPAFGRSDNPTIEPVRHLIGEVPAELQHRIRIESTLVRIRGGKSESLPLMPAWERPAANLAQRSVTYAHTPMVNPQGITDAATYLSSGKLYAPTLDVSIASDSAFDMSGNLIPMDAAQAAGAELFQTVAEKGDLAEAALAGLGSDDEATSKRRMALSEVRLKITAIAPGGQEREVTRVLYNPCNDHQPLLNGETCFPAEPTNLDKLALTTGTSVAVATSRTPESLLLDRALARIINNRDLWLLIIDPEKKGNLQDWLEVELEDTSWIGYLPFFQGLDSSNNPAHVYRSEPSIALFQQILTADNSYNLSMDILQNTKRAFTREGGKLTYDAEALVYEGIWETGAEYQFLIGDYRQSSQRAFPLLRKAPSATAARVTTDAGALPLWGKHTIKPALNAGYTAVIDSRDYGSNNEDISWYRIDPGTGETLGMNAQGRGGALEYAVKLGVGLTAIAPIYMLGCLVAGYDTLECTMFGRAVGTWAVGGFAMMVSVFFTVLLWPSEAN